MSKNALACYWYGCGAVAGLHAYAGWQTALAEGAGLAICLALVLWGWDKIAARIRRVTTTED